MRQSILVEGYMCRRESSRGCRYASECLACPYEDCILYPGPARIRWIAARNAEIRRLHIEGVNYAGIVEMHPEYVLTKRAIRAICSNEAKRRKT